MKGMRGISTVAPIALYHAAMGTLPRLPRCRYHDACVFAWRASLTAMAFHWRRRDCSKIDDLHFSHTISTGDFFRPVDGFVATGYITFISRHLIYAHGEACHLSPPHRVIALAPPAGSAEFPRRRFFGTFVTNVGDSTARRRSMLIAHVQPPRTHAPGAADFGDVADSRITQARGCAARISPRFASS